MREKALKKLKENIELPGFRKGTAPDSLVATKIGVLGREGKKRWTQYFLLKKL
jgi:FKBP-type peptidyl-prolyl cis-trans isomerase (trigger factor)